MSTIASMSVNLLAKTRGFDRPIDKSRGKLKRFGATSKAVRGQLMGLGTAALAAVGVAGFGSFIRGQMDTLDSLGKTADRLGITTEKLGAYRYGAELAGQSSKVLDNGMRRLARSVSESAAGFGEAKDSLRELKLDAKELMRLGLADQFNIVGGAINQVAREQDKIRLTQKIFGREGVGLINMFATDMERVAGSYVAVGNAISREDIAKVEEMNDAITTLSAKTGALGGKFTIAMAPEAVKAIDGLTVILENSGIFTAAPTAKDVAAAKARKGDPSAEPNGQTFYQASVNLLGKFMNLSTGLVGASGAVGSEGSFVGMPHNQTQILDHKARGVYYPQSDRDRAYQMADEGNKVVFVDGAD